MNQINHKDNRLSRRVVLGGCLASLIGASLPHQARAQQNIVYQFERFKLDHRELGLVIAAARITQVPANLTLAIAERESLLDPEATPIGIRSSAVGLHQFLEQTWLETIWENPREMFLSDARQKLAKTVNGDGRTVYSSKDSDWLNAVLDMRTDPYLSTIAMGLNLHKNRRAVHERIGYWLKMNGETYIPHVLGPAGAAKLITAALKSPDTRTDTLFSARVLRNRGVFYEGRRNRTAEETVRHLILDMENRRKKYRYAEEMFVFHARSHKLTAENIPNSRG